MASLRKKGKVWYVRVRDESGRQREVKAGPDKSVAQSIEARPGGQDPAKSRLAFSIPGKPAALTQSESRSPSTLKSTSENLEAKGCVAGHVDGSGNG